MEDREIVISLQGSKKFITGDPYEYFTVTSGTVYVYVVHIKKGVTGRSLFLCERNEGEHIPTLAFANSGKTEYWAFLLVAADKAVLQVKKVGDDYQSIREKFLDDLGNSIERSEEEGFSKTLVKWYISKLEKEKEDIAQMNRAKDVIRARRFNLMGSLFKDAKGIDIEHEPTGSRLYNIVSIFCEYRKLPICPYHILEDAYGDDFSIQDIARASHFVVREVQLGEKWWHKDMGPLIGFMKDGGRPVLLIPKGNRNYLLYDLEFKFNNRIDKNEAKRLSDRSYIAYKHLPEGKLSIKDVMKYGLGFIQKPDLIWYVVLYVLSTLVGLLLPLLNELLFDKIIPMAMMESVYQAGGAIFACMLGNMFFNVVQNLCGYRAVKTLEYEIVAATYDRIFRLPQKFVEKFGTTELIGRINSVSGVFSNTLTTGMSAIIGAVLSLFYLWRMFDKSHTLAWRGLIISLISGVIMFAFGYLRIFRERERLDKSVKASGMLYQYIAGILKIKTSGIENRSLLQYQKTNIKALDEEIKSTRISNVGAVFSTIITMIGTGIIYYTVVKEKHALTIGQYSAFNSAYGLFTSATGQLVNFFLTIANLLPVMERLKPIYETEAEIKDEAAFLGRLSGEIEANHLEFTYEGEEALVLKDISFKIKQGEYIGIVGCSGCGKSTLLKLMLGFEKPTKGKIYFDNKDADTLDKCELRRQMGVVLQDGQLVMGNIFTNVTLSAPNLHAEDVESLLEEVGLEDEVKRMPMGIFTSVSEGGGTVSGGQKQRILIARALANNPAMIFFDEATSALDNRTQAKVCESLEKRKITRIMIAHRLSTVKKCDRIFVMDEGQIVEEGDYQSLMERKGLFYELARRQQVL